MSDVTRTNTISCTPEIPSFNLPSSHPPSLSTPSALDIEWLINLFVQEHALHAARPFALFKRLWEEQGWTYMHLKIFDARTRHTYLTVACRLFVGVYFLYCMNASLKTRDH